VGDHRPVILLRSTGAVDGEMDRKRFDPSEVVRMLDNRVHHVFEVGTVCKPCRRAHRLARSIVRLADLELTTVAAGVPVTRPSASDGWLVWSSRPGTYRLTVERASEGPVATLRARDGEAGEGSMSRTVFAGRLRELRGRRVRLQARLRSEDGDATV
jgi:hypothetical protein